jgi:glycolate oxidase
MEKLIELLPGKISTEPEDLLCYGFDASGPGIMPSAVAWPQDVRDVSRIMAFAYTHRIPVIPRGAGSGMTGGSLPSQGGVILSLEKMNKIQEIDSDNLDALVEPGVINGKLQKELARSNLFYPPDPTSMNFCTIGGNVSENAGGPKAIKYGVTRDYVMGLEAVLPDGRIIQTGIKTVKGVVGYDLTSLLVGSEGTLAVVTKIRLKVLPLPEDVITLMVLFQSSEQAGTAVKNVIANGIIPCTLEFMDHETIQAVENYKPIGLPGNVDALLLIELDGAPSVISREAERISDICRRSQGEVIMAEDERARTRLWEARRSVSPALYYLNPTKINEDIVVPRSRIPDMLGSLRRLSAETGIKIVSFGHAGDGNIHVNIMVDRNNQQEYEDAGKLVKEIFSITLALGGTISGEHGIGLTKSDYISMEIKPEELEIMRKIKRVFDPKNILNPGKIFP